VGKPQNLTPYFLLISLKLNLTPYFLTPYFPYFLTYFLIFQFTELFIERPEHCIVRHAGAGSGPLNRSDPLIALLVRAKVNLNTKIYGNS
jgi:hypothetical protein